jgi:hypothetical protein
MKIGETTFYHNGDFSGSVRVEDNSPADAGLGIEVEYDVLEQFMAERWRKEIISYVEGMPLDRSELRDMLYHLHRQIFRSA